MEPPFKKRRGGVRQRLQKDGVANPVKVESALANYLLSEFAWGGMSVQTVQKIASLALKDALQIKSGGQLSDLETLAKLGGTSSLSNNMHRDIMKKFNHFSSLPEGQDVGMVFKNSADDKVQKVMLPHELFSAIYNSYPQAWDKIMIPNNQKLVEFWNAQENHPNMEGNPIKDRPDYKTKCVPLGFHGDEVPITGKGKCWCKSMLTFEWCSLVGFGSTCEKMLWVWGSFEKIMVAETLPTFFRVLAWSFFWLQQGRWPTQDWQGNPYPRSTVEGQRAGKLLANGFYATIWAVMGDLDYLNKTLQLPRSTSHHPCTLCRCTLNGPLSWKQNDDQAEWITSCWKPLEWIAWDGRSKVELFSIPGISAVSVALDYMHNKYLGADQYLYGSILYLLCYTILPSSPTQNLATCWQKIVDFYKANNVKNRFRSILKLSMFIRKTGVVKLRGKAGELKGICQAMLHLWQQHMNPNLETHGKIHLLLKMNSEIEEELSLFSDEICLPKRSADKCVRLGFAMIQLGSALQSHFADDEDCDKQLFNVTAKFHMILHSLKLSYFIHPCRVWCFMGEDFMRTVQKIGESCVRGLQPTVVSSKMMSHYRLGLHLELSSA